MAEWSDPSQTAYTMDILGNFTSIDRKNCGTSAAETRTHNATNELRAGRPSGGQKCRRCLGPPKLIG